MKFECVCWWFLHLIKNLSRNSLLGNPSIFTGSIKGSPPRSLSTSNISSAWFLPVTLSSLFSLFCWDFQKERGTTGSDTHFLSLHVRPFLASSLLIQQEFSFKVSCYFSQKAGDTCIKWSLVSCQFLGAHWHIWIGLLKLGSNIHLPFMCGWNRYSTVIREADFPLFPDQRWIQKTRSTVLPLVFPLTKLTLHQDSSSCCEEFIQSVWFTSAKFPFNLIIVILGRGIGSKWGICKGPEK